MCAGELADLPGPVGATPLSSAASPSALKSTVSSGSVEVAVVVDALDGL
jgi:hypothetical protein